MLVAMAAVVVLVVVVVVGPRGWRLGGLQEVRMVFGAR